MYIRQTRLEDIDRLIEVFEGAKEILKESDNFDQWGEEHPERSIIENDINQNQSYVVVRDEEDIGPVEPGVIVGTFMLQKAPDDNYKNILKGAWLNDDPHVVVHRVASSNEMKGVGTYIFDYLTSTYSNIRIDTTEKNKPMLALLKKYNFKRCTVVDIEHSTRVGFQYVSEE